MTLFATLRSASFLRLKNSFGYLNSWFDYSCYVDNILSSNNYLHLNACMQVYCYIDNALGNWFYPELLSLNASFTASSFTTSLAVTLFNCGFGLIDSVC